MIDFNILRLGSVFLPIEGLDSTSDYILKGVDGLNPPEIDVQLNDFILGGSFHSGVRPQGREIVALVGVNPAGESGQTPSQLRSKIYKEIGNPFVRLGRFTQDRGMFVGLAKDSALNTVASTRGEIKKIEASLFTQKPEVQVTIACGSPYLVSPNPHSIPFKQSFFYEGDAPAGFYAEFRLKSPMSMFTIRMGDADMTIKGTLPTNMRLRITTTPLERSLIANLPGDPDWYDVTYAIQKGSTWPMIYPGSGELTAFEPGSQLTDRVVLEDSKYYPTYWGV